MKETMKGKVPVLITTDTTKRGVFMGFIDPADADKETLEAHEVRMAVYWSVDVKGVIGLAAKGPSKNCKISPAAKKATINKSRRAQSLVETRSNNHHGIFDSLANYG